MDPARTEIICIIDRSGSMQAIRDDAIGGFNSFLEAQQKLPGAAYLTLVLFDHAYEVVVDGVPLEQVAPLDTETYVPRGTTALLDAVGRTIDDVGRRLARMPEAARPGKVIVAILTDGMENASSDYDLRRVSEMVRHQQDVYRWEFLFLAANQDAFQAAASLSIASKDAFGFVASGSGVREAYAGLSEEVMRRRKKA